MLSWVGVNMPCFSFIFFTINYNDRDKTISYYYVALHGGVCSAIELTVICSWVIFSEEVVFYVPTISCMNVCHAMFYSSILLNIY